MQKFEAQQSFIHRRAVHQSHCSDPGPNMHWPDTRLQVPCDATSAGHLIQDFRSIEELQTGCKWKAHMSGALVVQHSACLCKGDKGNENKTCVKIHYCTSDTLNTLGHSAILHGRRLMQAALTKSMDHILAACAEGWSSPSASHFSRPYLAVQYGRTQLWATGTRSRHSMENHI